MEEIITCKYKLFSGKIEQINQINYNTEILTFKINIKIIHKHFFKIIIIKSLTQLVY